MKRRELEKILRRNFDPYFNLKLYGKGEIELKCEVVATILDAFIDKEAKEAIKEWKEKNDSGTMLKKELKKQGW